MERDRDIKLANVYDVRNAPDGFIDWALSQGAVAIKATTTGMLSSIRSRLKLSNSVAMRSLEVESSASLPKSSRNILYGFAILSLSCCDFLFS